MITDEIVIACVRAAFAKGRPCAFAHHLMEIEPCAPDCRCMVTTRLILETAAPLIRAGRPIQGTALTEDDIVISQAMLDAGEQAVNDTEGFGQASIAKHVFKAMALAHAKGQP